ncbi:MAG TPA: signal peptidase I [Candidatus Nanopelagicaceae bacterium]|nr:signal peptidase I [Candidatus Nanopelagicaceae bacterium]
MKVPKKGSLLRELPLLLVTAIVASIVVKAFLFQAFYIPSGSMENTLMINDRVIVNKLGNYLGHIGRGDVVVFVDPGGWLPPAPTSTSNSVTRMIKDGFVAIGLLPDPADQALIKRVIGVPGDHIVCCDPKGDLVINGQSVNETYVAHGNVPSTMQFNVTVPKDSIWVMGDHRGASEDSRYHQDDPRKGMVPFSQIVGRAVAVVWPFNHMKTLPRPPELTRVPVVK